MKKEQYTLFSSDGRNKLHCVHWNCNKPTAVLQIVHGMTEYIDRYNEFAEFLCENNIAVFGHDHLGHGETAASTDDFGFFHSEKGADFLVSDTFLVTQSIKEKYPDVPLFVLGHSMGSFCVRNFMTAHPDDIAGFILMGTGHPTKGLANFAQKVVNLRIEQKGERYRSKLVSKLVFFQYMKGIKNPKTSVDWISRDEIITQKYIATPFCTFTFTLSAYKDLFAMIHHCIYEVDFDNIPKDMPILITSGEKDPVGDWGKAPKMVYDLYSKRDLQQVALKIYPDMRHEILNEIGRDEVYQDLLMWMQKQILTR